jgi:DNA-binding SARP family transcriptional activator
MGENFAQFDLRLLGPLEVRVEGRTVGSIEPKLRALLADLALHLGEAVSVDRLVDDLWGEAAPASAAHAVEVYVSKLRKALQGSRPLSQVSSAVLTTRSGYVLALPPESVDCYRFEALAEQGRGALQDGDAAAAALLREALALWRGPPYADFTYEPFAQTEIARLEELRLEAIEERIEADLAAGGGSNLVSELEALVRASDARSLPLGPAGGCARGLCRPAPKSAG